MEGWYVFLFLWNNASAAEIVPVAFTVKKIRIMCHIEDDKVSMDDIQEEIQSWEDEVQSTDIHAFNKL